MSDVDVAHHDTPDTEMRFEELEVTPELLLSGLTLWDTPLKLSPSSRLTDTVHELFELDWSVWPTTIGVSQISVSTQPNPLPVVGQPPEITWARVSIFGFGWKPGSPVITKWNNAFGFPDNGEGANSIKLQTPTPDSGGRFAFQTIHRGVPRPAKDWYWEANSQLVIVARQGTPGSPDFLQAHQRFIPPHVLWQWVPYGPPGSTASP
jgi:hypothetical protein